MITGITRTSTLAITLASSVLMNLSGCGGEETAMNVAVPAKLLACDESLKTAFVPEPLTSVVAVRLFRKGDVLLLSGTATAATPIAANDMCMVKLIVGPGHTGPTGAPSTSAGIGIEVWLPAPKNWNNRLHLLGGGGWAGGGQTLTTDLGDGWPIPPWDVAGVEGAVSASTDAGHRSTQLFPLGGFQYGGADGSFAMNPDGTINAPLWKDFSDRAIHKMAIKSKALALAYYGSSPRYSYLDGASTGGRQGLKAAQVNPGDFDGILVGFPAIHWTRFITSQMYPQVVAQRDLGGILLTDAQRAIVSNAAIKACDVVGGQHLGYLQDPASCTYDPTTDLAVICAANGGTNLTADCVTQVQANAMNKMWFGQTADGSVPSPFVDNGSALSISGNRKWFGLTRGADFSLLAGATPFTVASHMLALELQDSMFADSSFLNATGSGADRWKAMSYSDLSNAFDRGVVLQGAFSDINTEDPDLSAFRDRGGKMIMLHGLADTAIAHFGSVQYYESIVAKMNGLAEVQKFFRFYLAPGMGHGYGSNGTTNPVANPPLPTPVQMYELLTSWVEQSTAPGKIEVTSGATSADPAPKTSPLCVYPAKASYTSGNPNRAIAYACS